MNFFPDETPSPSAPDTPPDGPPASSDAADAELAAWKNALRADFEACLARIDAIPDVAAASREDANAEPDLYSFYEQFAATGAEQRKANRRTAEAMSQWGETLTRFEGALQPLRETAAQLAAAQPKPGEMSRAHSLVLVELLDRMHRLTRAFATPPAARPAWLGFSSDAAWRRAWEAQHQALDILVSHFEALLRKEGVTRIETVGERFNPELMQAVATESNTAHPPQTVLEEIAAGYLRHGELLRSAQVKVSRRNDSVEPLMNTNRRE
ncbi:MAG: nucleotide exchange factor GrpE [Opitutaceae bacterium]